MPIKCLICGKEVRSLSSPRGHLSIHNIHPNKYLEMFPDAVLVCEETRKLVGESCKGYKHSEETKTYLSEWNKENWKTHERKVWNKGLTTETDERVARIGDSISKTKQEKIEKGEFHMWNKGTLPFRRMETWHYKKSMKDKRRWIWRDKRGRFIQKDISLMTEVYDVSGKRIGMDVGG